MTNKKLNKFAVLPSYYEALEDLPEETQDKIYGAIMRYGIAGIKPQFNDPMLKAIFGMVKPNIDASVQFHKTQKENGDKGGRPNKAISRCEKTHSKPTQNPTETQPKPTVHNGFSFEKPNRNPTVTQPKPNGNRDSDSDSDSDSESEYKYRNFSNEKLLTPQKHCGAANRIENFEFLFYLQCYNRLFKRDCKVTAQRRQKYSIRRKSFSQEDILVSLHVMANLDFYQGNNEGKGNVGTPWVADPDFHLKNDSTVAKFLEHEDANHYREIIKQKFPDAWAKFKQEQKGQNDQKQLFS